MFSLDSEGAAESDADKPVL